MSVIYEKFFQDYEFSNFTINGIDIPIKNSQLKLAVHLGKLILNGPYQRIVIVDRMMGGQKISNQRYNNDRYCEYTVMSQYLEIRNEKLLNLFYSYLNILPKALYNIIIDYGGKSKVHSSTLAHYANQFFTTLDTLLIIHGNWPALDGDEKKVINYPKRKNTLCIVKVLEGSSKKNEKIDEATIMNYLADIGKFEILPVPFLGNDDRIQILRDIQEKILNLIETGLGECVDNLIELHQMKILTCEHQFMFDTIVSEKFFLSNKQLILQFGLDHYILRFGRACTDRYRYGDSGGGQLCRYLFLFEHDKPSFVIKRMNLIHFDVKNSFDIENFIHNIPSFVSHVYSPSPTSPIKPIIFFV